MKSSRGFSKCIFTKHTFWREFPQISYVLPDTSIRLYTSLFFSALSRHHPFTKTRNQYLVTSTCKGRFYGSFFHSEIYPLFEGFLSGKIFIKLEKSCIVQIFSGMDLLQIDNNPLFRLFFYFVRNLDRFWIDFFHGFDLSGWQQLKWGEQPIPKSVQFDCRKPETPTKW